MRLAVVVPFLNEGRFLPELLASIRAQDHLPSEMLLVDDGSTDGGETLAEQFASEVPWARVLRRPRRPDARDRLMTAAEYRAFQWGVERLEHEPDVVVKLDGDLRLPPQHFATAIARFVADETLGLTGAYLSYELNDGQLQRENHPSDHVRGPNKFYRWSCYQAIQPIEPFPGWEGVDEVKARMRGWRTESFSLEGQDPVHLRPTGVHDGRLRAYRRWGRCAWGYGAHPLHVLLGGIHRFQRRPYIAGGVSYIFGWASAALRRLPRVEDDVLAYRRRQDLADIRRRLRLARR